MSELKMSDADVGEMIAMCVESKLAGFDSVSVDPLHVVEMDSYYQSIIDKQAAEIEMLRELFKPLMREAQACQDILHSLAHNGEVCWDYSVDAKKVLEDTELALSATANGGGK